MSWVLIFGAAMAGFVELNTYETFESCEAAKQAATQAIAEIEGWTDSDLEIAQYMCIPKPD